MPKKDHSLATRFGNVGNRKKKEETQDNNINNNVNNDVNNNKDNNITINKNNIDDLFEGEEKRKDYNVKGIYFDQDVAEALEAIKHKKGRGSQSRLVNHAVRRLLVEKGVLK